MSADPLLARLAALPDRQSVERLLRQETRRHDVATVEQLAEEAVRLVHVDLDQAERLTEAAEWLAARLDDAYARARAGRARGNMLFARGQHAEAVDRFRQARALFESLGREVEAARTVSSSLNALTYLGRYEEARADAQWAREVFERAGERLRLARLDNALANLCYRQDRFPEALELYQRAYTELLRVGQPHDVGVAMRNIAVCYISLNRFPEALDTYRQARSYCEQRGLELVVVEVDYNIAYLYYLRGQYTRAISLYQAARARSEKSGDHYHKALCDLDQSELYLELNLVAEGSHLAQRAYEEFQAQGLAYEAAKALVNLAVATTRQGEIFRGLELFDQAGEMFEREGNRVWPALIQVYRAVALQQAGRFFEARRQAELALAFFEEAGLESKAALCQLVVSRVHLSLGEAASARARCLAALERLARADEPSLTYRAHFLLGQASEALGDREAALAAYRAAHARLETLRSHLEQDELKIGFLKDKLAVYESLVWLSLAGPARREEQEEAMGWVEQAKSRSLADLMAFRAHALPAREPAQSGLAEQVQSLRQELNWYYRKLDLAELRPTRSLSEVDGLRRESREREAQLLRALRELHSDDAELASLQAAGTIGLEAVRSTLPEGALILEYYHARGTILAFLITRRTLEVVPLTPVSRVRHLLRLLQFQLSKFRLGPEYAAAFAPALLQATQAHLRELYSELLEPLGDRLRCEHLVIVPHDFLHYVPFHALHDGAGYLLDRVPVSYAPSASVHHLCRAKTAAGRGALVLGVPDEATPHIRAEVEQVAAALPGARLFLGPEASADKLREWGPDSRYVHIATHGLFRYDNPMFSSVQLGDTRLSLFDLYQLELGAELVTLSGCGTGLNVVEGGDELMGLVRGLLYAGAQAALVTLWDVHDESTAGFMRHFYPRLQAGADTAQSVREAMQALRAEHPHPYYWAPFVLVGNAWPS